MKNYSPNLKQNNLSVIEEMSQRQTSCELHTLFVFALSLRSLIPNLVHGSLVSMVHEVRPFFDTFFCHHFL